MTYLGAIEAGGTKFNCAIGTGHNDILREVKITTTTPDETLGQVIDFFQQAQQDIGSLKALGMAAFGPLDLNKSSSTYGYITRTPKPHWSHTDITGILRNGIGVPVGLETDVNGAILAEAKWGAAQSIDDAIYVTIGTGIGGGIISGGKLLHGLSHPELGHMQVPLDERDRDFAGYCSFHGNQCLTGLASGPAMALRWKTNAENLPPEHEAWDLEAEYLAAMCMNLSLTLCPKKIILGGGVMSQPFMLDKVRQKFLQKMAGYLDYLDNEKAVADLIVTPELEKPGLIGAFLLADQIN